MNPCDCDNLSTPVDPARLKQKLETILMVSKLIVMSDFVKRISIRRDSDSDIGSEQESVSWPEHFTVDDDDDEDLAWSGTATSASEGVQEDKSAAAVHHKFSAESIPAENHVHNGDHAEESANKSTNNEQSWKNSRQIAD
ncbi:hypothetical protein D9619_012021 [Psilocybe cf. subviscida]|uniref:Uncharacterized protein n=1 Tax=Psilocybe cf. subviscida TaxID=2480587 RepID=A0A8H5B7L8_9AGAR|nr:hypothetical protein D9619_012021 [Psilocybe cf. subviscida]